jgi:thiol-disulfide isomerase/thioredoxin
MRTLMAAFALIGLAVPALADDTQPPKKKSKPEPTLAVGDKAPPLKATKWLQGAEVKQFAAGRVYVVEFWATWCGPCIVMMPHMAEMQAEYRPQGVTFIGYSAKDPNNTQEKVAKFVEKRGPKLGYTFAYGDDRETYNAWMKAANRNGIPCSFVVGRDGKIAYIGHPMYLGAVLPKVAAGTWSKANLKELDAIEADVNDVFKSLSKPDAGAGLKELAAFEKKRPGLKDIPYFVGPKLNLLLKSNQYDDAKKFAGDVMAKAVKRDDSMALRTVSAAMRSPAAKGKKELAALSIKAAEAALKLAGDKDAVALYYVAESHFAAGDTAKAKEYGQKAIAAAEGQSAGLKNALKKQVEKYDGEKKKDEKKKDEKK